MEREKATPKKKDAPAKSPMAARVRAAPRKTPNWRGSPKKASPKKRAYKEETEDSLSFDPAGFEYFVQLPQDIKLAIFDYISFKDWVLKLSPVCAEWRKLVTCSNRQKILDTSVFHTETRRTAPFSVLTDIAKNYQIYGLDINPALFSTVDQLSQICAASKKLNWVSLSSSLDDNETPVKNMLPNTVSSVSIATWDDYEVLKDVFPNIKELQVREHGIHKHIERIRHPNLKILHTVARNDDDAIDIITRIKSVAPSVENVHLQIGLSASKGKKASVTRKSDLEIDKFERLEKLAAEQKMTVYCRTLIALINHPDLFVTSFLKQGLPYSYYVTPNSRGAPTTLLREACHKLSLPVVKFLLENGHTTIEQEYSYKLPNVFNRVLKEVSMKRMSYRGNSSLISDSWDLEESKEMLDYLFSKGFDVNRLVDGVSALPELNSEMLIYILQNTHVDLKQPIDRKRNTLIHSIMSNSEAEVLQYLSQILSKEQLREIFSVKNRDGETPLHCNAEFTDEIIECLIAMDLGPVWNIVRDNSDSDTTYKETALHLFVQNDCKLKSLKKLLQVVPTVPPGLLWTVFTYVRNFKPLKFITMMHELAERGADFNEVIDGDPAITRLSSLTALVLRELANLGVNFNVTDSSNQTVLFGLADTDTLDYNEVVEILVKEFKLDVNHVDNDGKTPLISVMERREEKSQIQKLLELGANPNHCAAFTTCPLYLASSYGDEQKEIVELLLKAGADPNVKLYNEMRTQMVLPIMSILETWDNENCDMLELFVQYGLDLQIRDDLGNTLLHKAEDKYVEFLVKHIAVHETNKFGQAALWNPELSLSSLQMIIAMDPNIVNHVANDGSTVLHAKVEEAFPRALNFLIELPNIDMSVLDKRGRSFMHHTSIGDLDLNNLLKVFTKIKSDDTRARIKHAFNHVDAYGRTVLHYLCDNLSLAIVQQFVETFELDLNPNSPQLNLQVHWGKDIIEYLLSKGSDPNRQTAATGDTFLHHVCGNVNNVDLIRILLKYGANIDIKNSSGISPSDLDPNLKSGYQFACWVSSFNSSKRKYPKKSAKKKKKYYSESESYSDSDLG